MRKLQHTISHSLLTLFSMLAISAGLVSMAQADIVVIVNPQNPLTILEEEEVRRIYLGRTRMFPGSSQGIETLDLPETAERFAAFYQSLTHLTPAKLKRQRASYLFSGKGRLPLVLPDESAVKQHVASTPSAIGYVQADQVDASVKVVATVKTE